MMRVAPSGPVCGLPCLADIYSGSLFSVFVVSVCLVLVSSCCLVVCVPVGNKLRFSFSEYLPFSPPVSILAGARCIFSWSSGYYFPSILLVIGDNEARPHYLQ